MTARVVFVLLLTWLVSGSCLRGQEKELGLSPQEFRALCAQRAEVADKADKAVVAGRDGWLFLTDDLRYLGKGQFWGEAAEHVSTSPKPEWADPLPAILDFKKQLDSFGVRLLVVPVPVPVVVYADKLTSRALVGADGLPARVDTYLQEFHALLAKEGVHSLDLTAAFIAARASDAEEGPVCCRTDPHWSPRGCQIAARAIAQRLQSLHIAPDDAALATETRDEQVLGALAIMSGSEERETLKGLRYVGTAAPNGLIPLANNPDGPVLLIGDSHCLRSLHEGNEKGPGGGLSDQLAFELKSAAAVDLLAVSGSGASTPRIDLMRKVVKSREYLPAKKIVVWCFAARSFTEGEAWRLVPVRLP